MCDKEWHHYVLNVDIPTVALFVDGVAHDPFLVTEDYPLHHSKIQTQLVVGACWQGKVIHNVMCRQLGDMGSTAGSLAY